MKDFFFTIYIIFTVLALIVIMGSIKSINDKNMIISETTKSLIMWDDNILRKGNRDNGFAPKDAVIFINDCGKCSLPKTKKEN